MNKASEYALVITFLSFLMPFITTPLGLLFDYTLDTSIGAGLFIMVMLWIPATLLLVTGVIKDIAYLTKR